MDVNFWQYIGLFQHTDHQQIYLPSGMQITVG